MATAAPKLKNKRLSQYDRDLLITFARKQIKESADTAEVDAAYDLAAGEIAKVIKEKWPQKDMAVLRRYDAAAVDRCVYISEGGSNYEQFTFRADDKRTPLRPNGRGCLRTPIMLEGEALSAYRAYKKADAEAKEAAAARLSDFKALINGSRNFNEVAEVWPAANELRTSIVGEGTALAVLSADVVSRIKADPAYAVAA